MSVIGSSPLPPPTPPTSHANSTARSAPASVNAGPPSPSPPPSLAAASSPPPAAVLLPELPLEIKEKILSLELLGIDSTKALSLNPSLHSTPLPSIHSLISYLLSRGIHHKDLRRIFGMCPSLLTASISSDLAPVFRFLSDDLGVPYSAFRRPINKCPRLLAVSVRDQLRPTLIYLRRLGFRDNLALAYNDPVLLVSSVERTLMPKLNYVMSIGYTREEAIGMVLRCPSLFTFSIENNFKPKLKYFLEKINGRLDELKEFPQYFTFSLDKRIRPRHSMVMDSKLNIPLATMLKATDEEFETLLGKSKQPPV